MPWKWLFPYHYDCPGSDEQTADDDFGRQWLTQYQTTQDYSEYDAELVDRCHSRHVADLDGLEVEQPRKAGGDAR